MSLVTGASSGIGKATAVRLAQEGIHVAVVTRNLQNLERTAQHIRELGCQALVITVDLSIEAQAQNCITKTIETFGRLDILVNGAGIIDSGTVETTTLKSWDSMLNINLRSVFHLRRNG